MIHHRELEKLAAVDGYRMRFKRAYFLTQSGLFRLYSGFLMSSGWI